MTTNAKISKTASSAKTGKSLSKHKDDNGVPTFDTVRAEMDRLAETAPLIKLSRSLRPTG